MKFGFSELAAGFLIPNSEIGMGAHASRVRVQASRLNFQRTHQNFGGVENLVGSNFRCDTENHTPEACATKNLPARLVSISEFGLNAALNTPCLMRSPVARMSGTRPVKKPR